MGIIARGDVEQDKLLALETPEWREKRLIAEDPNTTEDVLGQIAAEVYRVWDNYDFDSSDHSDFDGNEDNQAEVEDYINLKLEAPVNPLVSALGSHPNTPASALSDMLDLYPVPCVDGLLRNPRLPYLFWFDSNFWGRVNENSCYFLLAEEDLPLLVAAQIACHTDQYVVESARLHIALTPEIQTPKEGIRELTQFWKSWCIEESHRAYWIDRNEPWHKKLIEFGLAPAWAMGDPDASSPPVSETAAPVKRGLMHRLFGKKERPPYVSTLQTRKALLDAVGASPDSYPYHRSVNRFVQFAVNLHSVPDHETPSKYLASNDWTDRLYVALKLPLTSKPYRNLIEWSPFDTMLELAHDGNRFVRWAAQTRLADPEFAFSWMDEDKN